MRTWLLLGLAVTIGCKKDAAGPGAPGAPASVQDQDALWQLAPQGATLGVVVSARGVTLVEHSALALRALLAQAPDLADLRKEFERGLLHETGSAQPMLADYGLSHDLGVALFLTADRDPIAVVPVADRDKFLAKVHGTRGADSDKIDDAVCKPLGKYYVCVAHAEAFATLGHAGLDAARKAAGVRGDIEIATAGIGGPSAPDVAAVLQLAPGAFVARGTVTRVPAQATALLGAPSQPGSDASAAGFGVIDLAPQLSHMPPVPLVAKVTLADLAASVAGAMTFASEVGSNRFEAQIPLRDAGPAKAVIEHCTEILPLAALGATASGGACHVAVPKSGITLDATVIGNALHVTAHATGAAPSGPGQRLPATAIGTLIAGSPWSVGIYGRGTLFAAKVPSEMVAALPPQAGLAMRGLGLVNELGTGVRKDGSTVSFMIGLRTVWANPDDVVRQLLAITPDQVRSGAANDTARKIAAAAPGSPFAADFRAGIGGGAVLATPIGVLGAIAVPAFMDYMKRGKQTEAELQLNKIGKNAKRVFIETSEFPKGEVKLTPAASCCDGPNHHCVTPAADWQRPIWQALDFEIDEPSLYRYAYKSDGKTFLATAVGDLDCDGVEASFELRGTIDGGNPTVHLTAPAPGTH